ncbi:MAG: hypothetical protein ACRD1E_05395 [Terriglobales bacterium]
MTRNPSPVLTLPPALPELGADRLAGISQGWQALRQRWVCMGPECSERNGLRAWWKLPARIQLQQGYCCSPECFQAAFERLAAAIVHAPPPGPARAHRIPLGLTLLSRGHIDHAQLRLALEAHHGRGGRVGEWLVRQGAASEDDVATAVALQWARPTFPLASSQGWRQCRTWMPLTLLEAMRMLPLHFAAQRRRLYVGFTQTVDSSALAALAQVFECETESCIVTDSALQAVFEQMRALPDAEQVQDVSFDRMSDAGEIAGIVRQYARYAEARQIRLASVGPFLWVRIRGQRAVHLSFRYR